MQRAAISISSNIAEGFERGTPRDELRFLAIAKASASELRSQLMVVSELELIDSEQGKELVRQCHRVGSLLFKLMDHKRSALGD
jgi:four helix bundle protein